MQEYKPDSDLTVMCVRFQTKKWIYFSAEQAEQEEADLKQSSECFTSQMAQVLFLSSIKDQSCEQRESWQSCKWTNRHFCEANSDGDFQQVLSDVSL